MSKIDLFRSFRSRSQNIRSNFIPWSYENLGSNSDPNSRKWDLDPDLFRSQSQRAIHCFDTNKVIYIGFFKRFYPSMCVPQTYVNLLYYYIYLINRYQLEIFQMPKQKLNSLFFYIFRWNIHFVTFSNCQKFSWHLWMTPIYMSW